MGAGKEGDREWSVILPSLIPRSCPPSVMKKKWEGLVYHVSVDCVWTHCMGLRAVKTPKIPGSLHTYLVRDDCHTHKTLRV